jgi:hypothetical protein
VYGFVIALAGVEGAGWASRISWRKDGICIGVSGVESVGRTNAPGVESERCGLGDTGLASGLVLVGETSAWEWYSCCGGARAMLSVWL